MKHNFKTIQPLRYYFSGFAGSDYQPSGFVAGMYVLLNGALLLKHIDHARF